MPYIEVDKEGNGDDRTSALYFFEEDEGMTSIRLGAAYRDNSCNIVLRAVNTEGHTMNMFGLSNKALVITYDPGTNELQLESINSRKLAFYQHDTGRLWQVANGNRINLGNGDKI